MLVLLYLREESYRKMHVIVLEVSLKRCCTWTPQKDYLMLGRISPLLLCDYKEMYW